MKLGILFPTNQIGTDPVAIRDFAQGAEAAGFDYLTTYEHVTGAHPDRFVERTPPGGRAAYLYDSPFHEPFTLYSFIAGLTSRIELCTSVVVLPQRQTALVAKQAAEVDVLTGGRLRLGIGTGWNTVEYQALDVDWTTRGKRMDEQVDLLRELFEKPLVDFDGRYHRVDRAGILPLPTRRIPIWMGGFGPVAWKRAARVGDGVILGWGVKMCAPAIEAIRGYFAADGRELGSFGFEMQLQYDKSDRWAGEISGWREAGGTHLSLTTMQCDLAKPADHIEAIRRFKRAADAG